MCLPDQLLSMEDKSRPSCSDDHRNKKKKRKVSFATATSVYETDCSKDTTISWYQAQDYTSFERERRETIVALQRVQQLESKLDPEQYSLRGLEQKLTRQQIMERKLKSLQCKRAVLEQQDIQKSLGYFNPELLEETSRMYSKDATQHARQRAIRMEEDSKL